MQDDLTKILASNLEELMRCARERGDSRLATVKQLSITSGVARATIDAGLGKRADDPDRKIRALRVDTLKALAVAFGVPSWMLLVSGLNPNDRPWLMTQKTIQRAMEGETNDDVGGRDRGRPTSGSDHRDDSAEQSHSRGSARK